MYKVKDMFLFIGDNIEFSDGFVLFAGKIKDIAKYSIVIEDMKIIDYAYSSQVDKNYKPNYLKEKTFLKKEIEITAKIENKKTTRSESNMANLNDHVYCVNCDSEQVVEAGTNTCLHCGEIGTLMWAMDVDGLNSIEQEIEKNPQILEIHENNYMVGLEKIYKK